MSLSFSRALFSRALFVHCVSVLLKESNFKIHPINILPGLGLNFEPVSVLLCKVINLFDC